MNLSKSKLSLGTLGCALALSGTVAAQEEPKSLLKQEAATAGKTDVAESTFAAAAKDDPKTAKDAVEAKISAGGLLATGNSRTLSLTSTGNTRIRRERNQFSAAIAGNYGRSAPDADSSTKTTVENLQGKIRYDRFLSEHVALFLSVSALHDRFQGLEFRGNVDPGVAYYVLDEKKTQLWGELGYDLQYDVRRDEVIEAAIVSGDPAVDKTAVRHSGRAFVGYTNAISKEVAFNTGLEYLQDVENTTNWRLNLDAGLTSAIGSGFSLATTFSLKYDHNPLPNIETTDTVTAVSVVYQLL